VGGGEGGASSNDIENTVVDSFLFGLGKLVSGIIFLDSAGSDIFDRVICTFPIKIVIESI
jgi:hypothetical protein